MFGDPMRGTRRIARPSVALVLVLGSMVAQQPSVASADPRGKTGYEREREVLWIDDTTTGRYPLAGGTRQTVTSISANGRWVAFATDAAMIQEDTNQLSDVYLYDQVTGSVELASRTAAGLPAVGPPDFGSLDLKWLSEAPAVSANGRYVAFQSRAVNLVPDDTNLLSDVFVYDRKTTMVARVSIKGDGGESSAALFGKGSQVPSISANGRYVSFGSDADNLVSDDDNGLWDVFVHDRLGDSTIRVSVSSDGNEMIGLLGANRGSISGNGRYVAFASSASNLVPDDLNQAFDVFVHDLKTRKTERISLASDGSEVRPPTGHSSVDGGSTVGSVGAISHDGRFVVFQSIAAGLVPNDNNFSGTVPLRPDDGRDIFVHDRVSGRTERPSVESDGREVKPGTPGWVAFEGASISPDGRFVASDFGGVTTGELGAPTSEPSYYGGLFSDQPFVYDRKTGEVDALHVAEFSHPDAVFDWGAETPVIARGGRFVSVTALFQATSPGPCIGAASCTAAFRVDRGDPVGVGGLGGSPDEEEPGDDRICITPDICIPPGSAVFSPDATDDLDEILTGQGANLYGASLANRPQYDDLFAVIELQHMPPVLPGISPIFYGLRFEAGGKSYEVRATSLLGGSFGLFDCIGGSQPLCTKVADLRGGYGTTGMRVVFSLPLTEIGLDSGRKLEDVEAFSALGGYLTGATKILDRVAIE